MHTVNRRRWIAALAVLAAILLVSGFLLLRQPVEDFGWTSYVPEAGAFFAPMPLARSWGIGLVAAGGLLVAALIGYLIGWRHGVRRPD